MSNVASGAAQIQTFFGDDDQDMLLSCNDPRDKFCFMLLDRIERLTDELHETRRELKQLQESHRGTFRIRVEQISDFESGHIYFEIQDRSPEKQLLLSHNVSSVIAAYNKTLEGVIYLTQYAYVEEKNVFSFHVFCTFNECVYLDQFYKYLNSHLTGLIPPKNKTSQKQRLRTLRIPFKQGSIDEGSMKTEWTHDHWLQVITIPLPPVIIEPIMEETDEVYEQEILQSASTSAQEAPDAPEVSAP